MPTSTFQEQGTVTLVPVASLPEERRCQSTRVAQAARMCWTVGHVCRACNELKSAVSSFFVASSASVIVFDDDVKKDMAPVLSSCFVDVRSLELKCEDSLSPSATRNTWHPRPRAEDVLCKNFLSAGKLTDSATGVDEKQLISAGQERIGQKNEKDRHVSFEVEAASRKKRK